LFFAGDGSAEESAKTEKAVVPMQRDRGCGPWGEDVIVDRRQGVIVSRDERSCPVKQPENYRARSS
jgi:hypothetical protein